MEYKQISHIVVAKSYHSIYPNIISDIKKKCGKAEHGGQTDGGGEGGAGCVIESGTQNCQMY